MNKTKLKKILDSHKKWLRGDRGGKKADLTRADLYGADLTRADLTRADLYGANLTRADLYGADLTRANLTGANLIGANLSGADLTEANLTGADLYGANLIGANLSAADLTEANLTEADIDISSKHFKRIYAYRSNCPEEGDFIGWKKVYENGNDIILKLLVTGARVSPLSSRKCRTNEVKVLAAFKGRKERKTGVFTSGRNTNFKYRIGETITAPDFDPNPLVECSAGIHFFITRQEAEDW